MMRGPVPKVASKKGPDNLAELYEHGKQINLSNICAVANDLRPEPGKSSIV